MASSFVTRIPSDDLKGCEHWLLPEVSSASIVPSAEKEDKDRLVAQQQDSIAPVDPSQGESIDDVDVQDVESFEMQSLLSAQQLQSITEEAEKEGFDRGREKGYEQGLLEGKKEGLANAEQHIAEQVNHLQTVVDALMMPMEREQHLLEAMLVDTVCKLTQAVVRRELAVDSSQIVTLVSQALATLPRPCDKLELSLNPADIDTIQQHIPVPSNADWHYNADETLLPGGCRLQTKESTVDDTIEHRLEQLLDDFVHKRLYDESAPTPEALYAEQCNTQAPEFDSSPEPDDSPEPDTSSLEPDTSSPEPDTSSLEPDTSSPEPDTDSPEPDTSSLELDTNSPEQKTSNPDLAINSVEPDKQNRAIDSATTTVTATADDVLPPDTLTMQESSHGEKDVDQTLTATLSTKDDAATVLPPKDTP